MIWRFVIMGCVHTPALSALNPSLFVLPHSPCPPSLPPRTGPNKATVFMLVQFWPHFLLKTPNLTFPKPNDFETHHMTRQRVYIILPCSFSIEMIPLSLFTPIHFPLFFIPSPTLLFLPSSAPYNPPNPSKIQHLPPSPQTSFNRFKHIDSILAYFSK